MKFDKTTTNQDFETTRMTSSSKNYDVKEDSLNKQLLTLLSNLCGVFDEFSKKFVNGLVKICVQDLVWRE